MGKDALRLNHLGIAVWLFYRSELPIIDVLNAPDIARLSKGKRYTLKQQAQTFLAQIRDPLLRKYFCTIGPGQGIIVRMTDAEKPYYALSRYFRKALEEVIPEGELNDKTAADYVQEVVRRSSHYRGVVRSGR